MVSSILKVDGDLLLLSVTYPMCNISMACRSHLKSVYTDLGGIAGFRS